MMVKIKIIHLKKLKIYATQLQALVNAQFFFQKDQPSSVGEPAHISSDDGQTHIDRISDIQSICAAISESTSRSYINVTH